MVYEIFVRQTEHGFMAAVPGLPNCLGEAAERTVAIAQVKEQARQWLATGEFIHLNGATTVIERGKPVFTDQAFLREIDRAVQEVRTEIDADPNQP